MTLEEVTNLCRPPLGDNSVGATLGDILKRSTLQLLLNKGGKRNILHLISSSLQKLEFAKGT